ncbi:MAG: Hsp70 family protein [Gammaproteobacteria bacterium]|nr:Hsp70 family protein [Gammaproteobacteria bacterium]
MTETHDSEIKRYSVGIDLGTTHCVLSSVDLQHSDGEQTEYEVLPIPQLVNPGVVQSDDQLPSFIYQAHPDELSDGDLILPWTESPQAIVGAVARQLGSKTPIRLVSSAKSWLCHAGVNCRSEFLPVDAPEEVLRISPFDATVRYLEHLRDAWNDQHADYPLDQQDLVITVPASFDPAARELTADAANYVGLAHAVLLEEPQSALYSWIQQAAGGWREQVSVGDIILVIDVGGGTTDLSLISVTEDDGNLILNRIAVGEHILLGGDNMDLALAYTAKAKLEAEGNQLEMWQIQALTHACRDAKESLFTDDSVDDVPLVVPSRGSSLIGGTLRTSLSRDDVNRVLVDGFLPNVDVTETPVKQARTGLTTIALPYAQDARITVHLAHFLSRQLDAASEHGQQMPEGARFLHPTAVLFNGGVFKADAIADRLMSVLNDWLSADNAESARLLVGADYDLAVAKGGSYYGYVRQGQGVRIRGGMAASYYVGVESAMPAIPGMAPPLQALCIAPFGMEEGTDADLPPYEFGVVVGEPVRFRFFSSTVRREDVVGARHDHWSVDELQELDEIEITLPVEGQVAGEVVPVTLAAAVTETGTLRLDAVAVEGDQRWKIEYDVRAGEDSNDNDAPDSVETVETDLNADSTVENETYENHTDGDDGSSDQDDQSGGSSRFGNLFGR